MHFTLDRHTLLSVWCITIKMNWMLSKILSHDIDNICYNPCPPAVALANKFTITSEKPDMSIFSKWFNHMLQIIKKMSKKVHDIIDWPVKGYHQKASKCRWIAGPSCLCMICMDIVAMYPDLLLGIYAHHFLSTCSIVSTHASSPTLLASIYHIAVLWAHKCTILRNRTLSLIISLWLFTL